MRSNIQKVIEAVSNTYGDDFFNAITLALHNIIQADYTFIAVLDTQAYVSKSIALVAKGKIADNFEYSLKDTPCADVADNSICCYREQVCATFPNDQLLIDMKIEAYLGIPLHDSKQKVMGLIVALYEQPLKDESNVVTLFQVFSGRIAAELERLKYESALEQKVLDRTEELSSTLKRLQQTQQQLVESDKMAALGCLVSGISHEVNTPLGIAITTHSVMADEYQQLNEKITNKNLSMKSMEHYLLAIDSALSMQGENLNRAKGLIENFKKIAVDQHHIEIETINIRNYYHNVTATLTSILKTKQVALTITGDQDINITTYPGVHAQILTNLISNSVSHGFNNVGNNNAGNEISITIQQQNATVKVTYQDNGIGLSEQAKKHVFEPFFTTARQEGGIGLGMSLVYNLITQKLNGNITLETIPEGTKFIYSFKASSSL